MLRGMLCVARTHALRGSALQILARDCIPAGLGAEPILSFLSNSLLERLVNCPEYPQCYSPIKGLGFGLSRGELRLKLATRADAVVQEVL